MATIQKVKRRSDFAYRVLIRQAGMKPVTKTFNTKRLANKFVIDIEGDRSLLIAHTQSKSKTPLKLVIDEGFLFSNIMYLDIRMFYTKVDIKIVHPSNIRVL